MFPLHFYIHKHLYAYVFNLRKKNGCDGPRVCHTEWSKPEREKQISYINAYMWHLEKWYRWIGLQGRNRDTDVENKRMDTKGEKVGGHTWILHICVSIQSCKPVHLYHFSSLHIYAFIYDICFSLSDWLHSLWQSLGPSTAVRMSQLSSFLWLNNIPWYICSMSSLSIHLWMGI